MRFTDTVEYQGFWGSFGDLIWWFLTFFVFVAYLFVLFAIISDLLRDHKLNGWWKAVWIVALLFFPFLTALVYLIARGRGMNERSRAQAKQLQDAQADYVRSVAGTAGASPADEIAKARTLLDAGAISQAEYDGLKTKALQ